MSGKDAGVFRRLDAGSSAHNRHLLWADLLHKPVVKCRVRANRRSSSSHSVVWHDADTDNHHVGLYPRTVGEWQAFDTRLPIHAGHGHNRAQVHGFRNVGSRQQGFVRGYGFQGGAARQGWQTRVSTDGGGQPLWRNDGRELFYVAPDGTIMSVAVTLGDEPRLGRPQALFDADLETSSNTRGDSVSGDGQRFLVVAPTGSATARLTVVVNWDRTSAP